jgi:LPXTG-motif cell wall-anchored protein
MVRRILLTVALICAAGAMLSAPASAQNYGGCQAQLTPTTAAPGGSITVSGSGAPASSAVSASLDAAVIGSGTADGAGNFSFSATVPATASGNETVTVTCGTSGTATAVLSVTTAQATTTTTAAATTTTVAAAGLPRTGSSDAMPMTVAGLAAVGLGGAALVVARRRSESASA